MNNYFIELLKKAAKALTPEMQRAKNVDLVTLPKGISGTNCANCRFIEKSGFCGHPDVKQQISDPPRMCCAKWDAVGTKRAWEDSSTRKT
jgi:hypothetical protein